VPAAHIAEKPFGGRVDPAHDACCVEEVARDADAAESLLEVAPYSKTSGRHGRAADRATERRPASTLPAPTLRMIGIATSIAAVQSLDRLTAPRIPAQHA
jgi:hypothetical protein